MKLLESIFPFASKPPTMMIRCSSILAMPWPNLPPSNMGCWFNHAWVCCLSTEVDAIVVIRYGLYSVLCLRDDYVLYFWASHFKQILLFCGAYWRWLLLMTNGSFIRSPSFEEQACTPKNHHYQVHLLDYDEYMKINYNLINVWTNSWGAVFKTSFTRGKLPSDLDVK